MNSEYLLIKNAAMPMTTAQGGIKHEIRKISDFLDLFLERSQP